ncbi:MAG: hypothetical protein AAGA97_00135 [Pseudomonadota bacterium]
MTVAFAGQEALIVEKNLLVGEETSARNSELIRTGIYSVDGLLKVRNRVHGRQILYTYCHERGVSHHQYAK